MKFLDRALRLIRADAHGVMDQLEERSLLLKQHLREAELEITRKRVSVEALEEQARDAVRETGRLERRLVQLDEDVELALAEDREELARFALKKLLPVRRALRSVRERAEEIQRERDRVAARLAEQQAEFDELRGQVAAKLESARRESAARKGVAGADVGLGSPACLVAGASDEEVELELLRRRGVAAGGAA